MTGFCPLFVHFFFCAEGENDILTMFLSYFLLGPLTPQKSIFSDITENLMNAFYQELLRLKIEMLIYIEEMLKD